MLGIFLDFCGGLIFFFKIIFFENYFRTAIRVSDLGSISLKMLSAKCYQQVTLADKS